MSRDSLVEPASRAQGLRAAVDARGLVKLFGSTPALLRVDLIVPAGTVCAIVGANGAGKTTLLRILATALRPTAGTACICGFDIRSHAQAVRRVIDFLPAAGGFYPELSAPENLRFAVAMRGSSLTRLDLRRAIERAGLAGTENDPVRTYSVGMTRRLSLARLMLTRPRLALLDEPYAGLDDAGRELVDQLLSEARAEGRTAVVATHEQARIDAVADHVCRLERGLVLEADGSYRMPAPAQSRLTALS